MELQENVEGLLFNPTAFSPRPAPMLEGPNGDSPATTPECDPQTLVPKKKQDKWLGQQPLIFEQAIAVPNGSSPGVIPTSQCDLKNEHDGEQEDPSAVDEHTRTADIELQAGYSSETSQTIEEEFSCESNAAVETLEASSDDEASPEDSPDAQTVTALPVYTPDVLAETAALTCIQNFAHQPTTEPGQVTEIAGINGEDQPQIGDCEGAPTVAAPIIAGTVPAHKRKSGAKRRSVLPTRWSSVEQILPDCAQDKQVAPQWSSADLTDREDSDELLPVIGSAAPSVKAATGGNTGRDAAVLSVEAPGPDSPAPNPEPDIIGQAPQSPTAESGCAPVDGKHKSGRGPGARAGKQQPAFTKGVNDLLDGEEGLGEHDGRLYRTVFEPHLQGQPSCTVEIGMSDILDRLFPGAQLTSKQRRTRRRALRDLLDELAEKCYIDPIKRGAASNWEKTKYAVFSPDEAYQRQRARGYKGWKQTGPRKRVLIADAPGQDADR
jgi:hypothetical protein